MSTNPRLSLHTLPVELVYRILDKLDILTIFCSFQSVCQRFNIILNTYEPYKVCLHLLKE
jgi:hypothetical protein